MYSVGVIVLSVLSLFCTESSYGFRRRWYRPLSEYVQSSGGGSSSSSSSSSSCTSYVNIDKSVQNYAGENKYSNGEEKIMYQYYLRGVFRSVEKESTSTICCKRHPLFSQLRGSFSQIGSNPNPQILKSVSRDAGYHWFDGDGMIHTVFFNQNQKQNMNSTQECTTEISYVNRWVQTKRFHAEEKWGKKMYLYFGELRGIRGIMEIMKWSFVQLCALVPGAKGTANTAFLEWNKEKYALHEGDFPYRIELDASKPDIITREQFVLPHVKSVTAHPKIDDSRKQLYLYGYNNHDFSKGTFYHNVLDVNMNLLHQSNISLINNGMIHDVAQTRNHLIIPDMPLKYDFNNIMDNRLPLSFDKANGITRFGVLHKDNGQVEWFDLPNENIFIFHFTEYAVETPSHFTAYACVMDFLDMDDFVHLNNPEHKIRGNLRLQQIRLDKRTKQVEIVKNDQLENIPEMSQKGIEYNMDFPMQSKLHPRNVYCSIFNSHTGKICGFTLTKHLNYFSKTSKHTTTFLLPENIYANSEPQVVLIDGKEYLLCFTFTEKPEKPMDETISKISLIRVSSKEIHSIEIPGIRIPPGFHSLYSKT